MEKPAEPRGLSPFSAICLKAAIYNSVSDSAIPSLPSLLKPVGVMFVYQKADLVEELNRLIISFKGFILSTHRIILYELSSEIDNEHYDAMCAADQGIIYDGQMSSAAVACHLPNMNLIKMRMHHQWYHDLFNRWWNDMNIVANNNINPELIGGEAWFGKIADSLAENYINPDARYQRIEKWDTFDLIFIKGRSLT